MANSIASLIKKLPNYATDIKENLGNIFTQNNPYLTQEELYAIALTIGYTLKHENVLNSIRADAKLVLEDTAANACKIAAVMMSMNNMFYNFKSMTDDAEIEQMESRLKMSSLQSLNVDMKAFEMCCLAVSIFNKCHYCIKIHQKKLLKRNVSKETLLAIGRIVAVLFATVTAIDIESLRSYDFIVRGEASVDD